MKLILAICGLLALCSAVVTAFEEVHNFNLDEELSPEDLALLKELVAREKVLHDKANLETIEIDALVNDYLDKVLANARSLIIADHLDPTGLPDQFIDIGIGNTNLTEGVLNDTSTIERYENATISYNSDSKLITAEMVLRFQDLKFLFKYHTKVTLISITGQLHGDIEHIHIHVKLGFDLKEGLVFVDTIDFKHTGDIKIWFTGNDLVDWIANAMSTVITGILHNLILDIVKDIVANPINELVDAINKALHPDSFF